MLDDPERIGTIGKVMRRYTGVATAGMRVRDGMEGDPCYAYADLSSAPCGVVEASTATPTGC